MLTSALSAPTPNPSGTLVHIRSLSNDLVEVAGPIITVLSEFVLRERPTIEQADAKGMRDLACQVDEFVEQQIVGTITSQFPGHKMIGEEATPDAELTNDPTWIIDPLDSTIGYLYRLFPNVPSIMVSHCVDKEVVLALIHFPLTYETFYAVKDRGTFKDGRKITCGMCETPLTQLNVIVNKYGDPQFRTPEFRKVQEALDLGAAGSVIEPFPASGYACRVAEDPVGMCGAVVHDNNPAQIKQELWDRAPQLLMIREAGGVALNLATGKDLGLEEIAPFVIACDSLIGLKVCSLSGLLGGKNIASQ